MKNNANEKFKLTEPVILAFEREKQDIKLLKNYKKKEKARNNKKLIFFRILFILLILVSTSYIIIWFLNTNQNKEISSELSQYISADDIDPNDDVTDTENNGEFSVNFNNLKNTNKKCFAWLTVNGTNINYPIVHDNNNEYYLKHSFDNKYNVCGWPFADYRDLCDGSDKNLVIYGHNIRSGSMFGTLKKTLKEDWYSDENNLTLTLYTPEETISYQVFSVYEIKAETYYTTVNFSSDSKFETFLKELKKRSIYNFKVDLTKKDQILTLSTCSNNNKFRTVLHAKKIQAEN